MRKAIGAGAAAAAVLAGSAATAQGILVATDVKPTTRDFRSCMVNARKALSGTGMVLQTSGPSVIGSNEERTVTLRCDVPDKVVFVEAFFPDQPDVLDPILDAFESGAVAPLVASVSKSHQYTVDCTRQSSCQIDAAAICKQAYPASAKPSTKVLKSVPCADAQGTYTCSIDYELNCS